MKIKRSTINQLEKIAKDLYESGYLCHISDDIWFKAYAIAMYKVVKEGRRFTDNLIDNECYNIAKNINNE